MCSSIIIPISRQNLPYYFIGQPSFLISFMKQIYLNAISSILFINSYNHSLDIIPVINKQVPTKTSLLLVLHSSNILYTRLQLQMISAP